MLYATIVWWGTVSLVTAIELALAKYVFKLFIAAFDTPFIYWARRWSTRGLFEARSPQETEQASARQSSPYPQSVAQ